MNYSNQRWIAGSAFVCAVLIYIYPLALPTPLLDPDEGLHAAISQHMVESGDYLTPRFLGKPFLDKPILYFAAQAFSLRVFGMHEAAVRLPGLLFALFGALTTALLAGRLFDRQTGWLALLVSLTSIIPASLAQSAAHDVALVPWTNLLLVCLWEADCKNSWRRRAAYTLGAALCVALAVLTKGLIGIAVVAAGCAIYIVVLRKFTLASTVPGVVSFAGGILLASPWFIWMELQVPGYLHYYFVERHLHGFATSTQPHGQASWYFHLVLMLAGTLPWCFYLLPAVGQSWIDRRRPERAADNRATVFVWCWLAGGLVFLSVANSKLITYSLPLYPAVAILVAHAWKQFLAGDMAPAMRKGFGWIFALFCVVGLVVPLGLLIGFDHFNGVYSPPAAYVVAALGTGAMIAALALLMRGRPTAAVACGAQVFALLFVAVMTWPMQPLAEQFSQRQLAADIMQIVELPDRIVVCGDRAASLVFYLERDRSRTRLSEQISDIETRDGHRWEQMPPDTLLVVDASAWSNWPNADFQRKVQARRVGEFCVVTSTDNAASIAKKPGATHARESR